MIRFTKGLLAAAVLAGGVAQAALPSSAIDMSQAFRLVRAAIDLQTADVIRWKVGDYHEMKIEFLMPGTGRKQATKEDTARNAIWLQTDITLLGQAQKTEALISRENGEVLELIVNGQRQDPGAGGDIEIIEQSETSITVPAGTFDCFYIKAKVTQQGQTQEMEAWVNPIDVNLDGMLKTTIQSQFGPISIILQRFGSR